MHIERASKQDFSELMDLMARCFRVDNPRHPRFEDLLPDLYPRADEAMRRHYIIRRAGRIAASVGVYPLDLQIGSVRLCAAGIGAVSTAPEFRGQGLMSALLREIRRDLFADEVPLSWLSGLRDRYAHFGWEKAGTDPAARISVARLGAVSKGWKMSRWDPEAGSLHGLKADDEFHAVRGFCDDDALRLKYRRLGTETWQAVRGGQRAHLAANVKWGWVSTWGGSPSGVRALMRRCLTARPQWNIRLPPARDAYADLFRPLVTKWTGAPDNLAVIDLPALARAYEPYWADVWPKGRSLHLRMAAEAGGRETEVFVADGQAVPRLSHPDLQVRLNALRMASLAFGPTKPCRLLGLGQKARWLNEVLPLPFHVPALWRV